MKRPLEADDSHRYNRGDVFVLKECVTGDGLDHLLANLDTAMVPEERVKFSSYASDMLWGGNCRIVAYSKVAHGWGRLYADGALSMQGFSKPVRSVLAGKLYHDIDIENCHPVILLDLCKREGWEAPILEAYVNDREFILADTSLPRGDAKVAMLTIMYGGNPKHNFPMATVFKREMSRIADLIWNEYPLVPVSQPRNARFSRMSLLIQDLECRLLMEIAAFFRKHGYRIGVYVFDGLMIYRKATDGPLDSHLLRACERVLSIPVVLAEKTL